MNKNKLQISLVTVVFLMTTLVQAADQRVSQQSKGLQKDSAEKKDAKITDLAEIDTLNIRFIDSFSAMRTCEEGQQAGKKLESKRDSLGKDIQENEQKIAQKVSEFQSKAPTLSETARAKEEKELRRMKTDYETKVRENEYEMKLAMQKTTEELARDMEQAVAEVAKRDNLDAVVDTMTGRVIYAADKLNITEKVVKEMDVRHEKKLAQNKKTTQEGLKMAKTQNPTAKKPNA